MFTTDETIAFSEYAYSYGVPFRALKPRTHCIAFHCSMIRLRSLYECSFRWQCSEINVGCLHRLHLLRAHICDFGLVPWLNSDTAADCKFCVFKVSILLDRVLVLVYQELTCATVLESRICQAYALTPSGLLRLYHVDYHYYSNPILISVSHTRYKLDPIRDLS